LCIKSKAVHLRLKSFLSRSGGVGKTLLAACFAVCLSASASAQIILRADSVRVYFPTGKSNFDPSFQDNGAAVDAFIQTVRSQWNEREEAEVEQVIINSSSSPEGSDALNRQLSQKRRESILQYLRTRLRIKSEDSEYSHHITDWPLLRRLVEEDGAMPAEYREAALEKLGSQDPSSIKQLQGTPAWKYLLENIFPQMRTTMVVFVWETWAEAELPELALEDNALEWPDVVFPALSPLDDSYSVKTVSKRPSTRDIVVKLNMLSLPALVVNAGIEIQPLPHFSISIPIYYTGLNWFSETIKFRTLAFQPELRYWLRKDLHGLFFNAHATFGWYNVALGGDYRYQDHAQKTPSLGGGIGVGYKVTLGRNNDSRWGLEMGIGGGVLPLHYDMYYNMHNGRLAGEDRYTYWGVDQAFISLTYRLGRLKFQQK
jgi:hypothetical protein